MTNEPPKGIRNNLTRTYLALSDEMLDQCNNPNAYKKLVFAVSFFHALLLDRRKFGPLGWNIPYQFTEKDLEVAMTQIKDFLNHSEKGIPYKVIHFLTYDVIYGGRVTDDKDRTLIRTILEDFVNPGVMQDTYKFSASGRYISIPASRKAQYLEYISTFEAVPHPEVFGLHENADITSAQDATNVMFSTVLALLPRTAAGKGKSREEIIGEMVTELLKQIPIPFEIESVMKRYPTLYTQSMNTVLVQETNQFNRLINQVRNTLRNLAKGLKGEMLMSEEMEQMATSLINNQVPELWSRVGYPSLKPLGAWVQDLIERVKFIDNWIEQGVPNVMWISGFFFPQGFLTGALQNYARKKHKPIDTINFGSQILDKVRKMFRVNSNKRVIRNMRVVRNMRVIRK